MSSTLMMMRLLVMANTLVVRAMSGSMKSVSRAFSET
jgi:hypothetical protein